MGEMGIFQALGLVILAAAVDEGVIEFIISPVLEIFAKTKDTEENKPQRTVILNGLSAILGVLIAVNFSIGLFVLLGGSERFAGVDQVLTGVLVGRGSNYIHGFVEKFIINRIKPTK